MPTSNKWKVWRIIWPAFNTAIGITALCISLSFSTIQIKSETYIGVIATLIGGCATLMVINQIISYISFRNAEKQITTHDLRIAKMYRDIKSSDEKNKGNLCFAEAFTILLAEKSSYPSAILLFLDALSVFLVHAPDQVTICLNNIDHCFHEMTGQGAMNLTTRDKQDILQKLKHIKTLKNHCLIKDRIKNIEDKINSFTQSTTQNKPLT